jgi:hypothetical protein
VSGAWLPDGQGLSDEARGIIAEHGGRVHLRLTSPSRQGVMGACDSGLGEWWSGLTSDVTCPACLEVVHA